jgi:hypothetical protein
MVISGEDNWGCYTDMATLVDSAFRLVLRCSESFDHHEFAVYFEQRYLRSLHIAWKQYHCQLQDYHSSILPNPSLESQSSRMTMLLLASAFSFFWLATIAKADVNFTNWAPPGPGDVRGPCPAMNSMANHHIIPHHGMNLTIPMLADALAKTFNLSIEMGTIVSGIGLATAPDPSLGYFNLNHLNKHNAFEHDASLSRVDYYFSGDDGIAKFDNATFNRWFSHFDGLQYIDIETAAKARYAQVQYSRKHTPGFTYLEQHRITSYAETIKYLKTMVDSTGKTRRDFVKILFGKSVKLRSLHDKCLEPC